jgi:hypothetical protein
MRNRSLTFDGKCVDATRRNYGGSGSSKGGGQVYTSSSFASKKLELLEFEPAER